MRNKDFKELKEEYLDVPIPEELDAVVKKALREGGRKKVKMNKVLRWVGGVAAAMVLFTTSLNLSPVLAKTLAEVPGMGNVVKVLTFSGFTMEENNFEADIKVPVIEGLEDKTLEATLNEKYLAENKELYEAFMADVALLKEEHPDAHMGIDTGYVVKTDNEQIFSIGRYVLNTAGSSSTVFRYDTVDKKNQILITLPSLFKGEEYIPVISENIKQQMLEQMQADETGGVMYWVEGADFDFTVDPFAEIAPDQSFYINNEGKLVISFDKYEVGPGVMGVVEFVVPTEILTELLVSDEYL